MRALYVGHVAMLHNTAPCGSTAFPPGEGPCTRTHLSTLAHMKPSSSPPPLLESLVQSTATPFITSSDKYGVVVLCGVVVDTNGRCAALRVEAAFAPMAAGYYDLDAFASAGSEVARLGMCD